MTTETKFTVGEYTTRGGCRARVYATDGGGTHPIHGAVCNNGDWLLTSWRSGGRVYAEGESQHDLMPPLRECWRVTGSLLAFDTLEKAEEHIRLMSANGDTGILGIRKYREVRDDQA